MVTLQLYRLERCFGCLAECWLLFYFGSTVFLNFFSGVCPQGVGLPCGVYALVGYAFESVFSFLFFGALPHTRLRVSLTWYLVLYFLFGFGLVKKKI
jgi:hypothetical protein